MKLINGIQLGEDILQSLAEKIKIHNIRPRLDIFCVGKDFASDVYINKKKEAGEQIGIEVVLHRYDELSEDKLIEEINKSNRSNLVNGIIVQLPLPEYINKTNVLLSIYPEKDVDGLNPLSLGSLWNGSGIGFASATPVAVIECLKYVAIYENSRYEVSELSEKVVLEEYRKYIQGKRVLIINRSNIIGKPLAALLINDSATVTIAHSKSKDIKKLCLENEIIISGVGKSGFITADMIPENSIVIDAGINNTALGVGGDVDYRGAESRIKFITPVPGGVGPLTVACLMKNTVEACLS